MGKTLKQTISTEHLRLVAENIFNGIKQIPEKSRPDKVYLCGLPQESLVRLTVELGIVMDEYHKKNKNEDMIEVFTGEADDGGYEVDAGSLLTTYKFDEKGSF